MPQHRSLRALALIAVGASIAAPSPLPAAAQKPPRPPARRINADEAGHIPILMYHAVGAKGQSHYDKLGLNIRPETFRKHLEMMYAAGWHPVNMRDVLTARIAVPAGKTPVVLTFDDARESQFRYRKDGSIDPDCVVGILLAFHKKRPDWPLRASFYVLPESRYNPAPFGQEKWVTRKLHFLVDRGFEIANHSTSHHLMRAMSDKRLAREMAASVRYFQRRVPGLSMETMALPYGIAPRDPALRSVLLSGSEGGTTYRNRCILLAGGDPSYPPAHRRFDNTRITRIGSNPGNIELWIQQLRRGRPYRPYISDGAREQVTIPRSRKKDVDPRQLDGARLVVYEDTPQTRKPTAKTTQR